MSISKLASATKRLRYSPLFGVVIVLPLIAGDSAWDHRWWTAALSGAALLLCAWAGASPSVADKDGKPNTTGHH